MEWYLKVLQQYATFSGRARRKEYWMFILINILISVFLGMLSNSDIMRLISMLYSLAVLIPGIAVTVRRLHDTGRVGWWILVSLIPLLGTLLLIYFTVQDSQPEDNEYGSCPK